MATAFQFPPEDFSTEEVLSKSRISWKKRLMHELRVQGAILFFLVALGMYGYGLSAFLPLLFGEGSVEWVRLSAFLVASVPMVISWSLVMYHK